MLEIHRSGKELPLTSAHSLKYFKASHLETVPPPRLRFQSPYQWIGGVTGGFGLSVFNDLWFFVCPCYWNLQSLSVECELMILMLAVSALSYLLCLLCCGPP